MVVHRLSADSLQIWPDLVRAFQRDQPELRAFHEGRGTVGGLVDRATRRKLNPVIRSAVSEVLRSQYHGLEISPAVTRNLERFAQPDSVCITTGHQLCLGGGPLYFWSKMASVITLAREVEKQSGVPVIPVFWMATEDHDFEEINHFFLNGTKRTWNSEQRGAVGRFGLEGLDEWFDDLISEESLERWSEGLGNLRKHYQSGNLAEATRGLVNEVFGPGGLLILDADDVRLKDHFIPILRAELLDRKSQELVESQSESLRKLGYKTQVNPREINLFYLHGEGRDRIVSASDGYQVHGTGIQFSESELLTELEAHPENFSPNVILRPVYQEVILPNLAYVGGPSELSYWLQLKAVFDHYHVPFPHLRIRHSSLFLPVAAERKRSKLDLELHDLFRPADELKHLIAQRADLPDTTREAETLLRTFDELAAKMVDFDLALKGSAAGERARLQKSLDQLGQKLIRAAKSRQSQQIQQLESLLEAVFPGGTFQERKDSIVHIQRFFEDPIIEAMLEHFHPESTDVHIFTVS